MYILKAVNTKTGREVYMSGTDSNSIYYGNQPSKAMRIELGDLNNYQEKMQNRIKSLPRRNEWVIGYETV